MLSPTCTLRIFLVRPRETSKSSFGIMLLLTHDPSSPPSDIFIESTQCMHNFLSYRHILLGPKKDLVRRNMNLTLSTGHNVALAFTSDTTATHLIKERVL